MAMTAREAFERGTETFNAHDIKGFADVLAEDVVFKAPGGVQGQGQRHARNPTRPGSEPFRTRTSTFTESISSTMSRSRKARSLERTTGVLHGPAGDVPPTGRRVSVDYVNVLRFKGGNVSFSLTFDRLAMLEQLGFVPAPPPAG